MNPNFDAYLDEMELDDTRRVDEMLRGELDLDDLMDAEQILDLPEFRRRRLH